MCAARAALNKLTKLTKLNLASLPFHAPIWIRSRGPRLLSHHSHPGWKLCELEVQACQPAGAAAAAWWRAQQPVQPPQGPQPAWQQASSLAGSPQRDPPASPPASRELYECTIRLITGRTHQIRAQLAAQGAPLLGDTMYCPVSGLLVGKGGVLCQEVLPAVEATQQLEGPLGLHAWRLEWGGRAYQALAPWEDAAAAPP